jgi:hypothetical protein
MDLRAGVGLIGYGTGGPGRGPDKNQVGFLPIFAYLIRAWVHSKNAARQKSTGINGARSCVCIGTRSARGRSNLPGVFIYPLARLHLSRGGEWFYL